MKRYLNKNGHLPEIPSESITKESGISLGEMNARLLQKIEELTLYVIEQNKQNQELKATLVEFGNKQTDLLDRLAKKRERTE